MFVITADQKGSRRAGDRVPEALARLRPPGRKPTGIVLPFERTVGDEVQAVLSRAEHVVVAVTELTRLGDWRIGIGLGGVDRPLPRSARAASGPAFIAAREAIVHARSSPVDLAVRGAVTRASYAADDKPALAESALWMLVALLRRRTEEGWEVADLLESGSSGQEAAATLGISSSAVSQRAGRAALQEVRRGQLLAATLLEEAGP